MGVRQVILKLLKLAFQAKIDEQFWLNYDYGAVNVLLKLERPALSSGWDQSWETLFSKGVTDPSTTLVKVIIRVKPFTLFSL